MTTEGHHVDRKSLRQVSGPAADFDALARDCVCFANAAGGNLLIGIEDNADQPSPGQRIPPGLPDRLRRRISELTVNVTVSPELRVAPNGGEYVELHIARSHGVASTSDGRYFIRVGDHCKPVVGDEVLRLTSERGAVPWETMTTAKVPRRQVDPEKLASFVRGIGQSDRVKDSVKEKTPEELLDHYQLADGACLTNLGILCLGRRADRARLGTAPVVQFIKYDEQRSKVNKLVWDDYELSPMELVEAVWRGVPDFRERYELPDGLYRQTVPVYDEVVVRELLVNALVHRPYTQRGDIFLNLHPDRLEVVNPGTLPFGVTPANVLHTSVRRNDHLARAFHDLKLMEREGSGFDKMYEVLLSQGRPVPEVREGPDRVEVTVRRRILNPRIIDLVAKADEHFQLTQRERITLGLLAQHEALTARELAGLLELGDASQLSPWLDRLQRWGLVGQTGRTQATRYFVEPAMLRRMEFDAVTTLKRIEPHRLRELILEDLRRYPRSSIGDIQGRVGPEIPRPRIKRTLDVLIDEGLAVGEGEKRWRRYSLAG